MGDAKVRPVAFSSGKPMAWWQRPSGIALVASAVAALALGIWIYTASASSATAVTQPSPDAVQATLLAGKPTVIEFGANNCVSCREMKPVLHALALDPRIAVADIDILKERMYIGRYQIRLMPTQVFYDAKGNETSRHMGKISGEEILARLGVAPKAAL